MTIYNVIPDMRLVMFSEAVAASILGLFPANRLSGEKIDCQGRPQATKNSGYIGKSKQFYCGN
jgi:hypothetical protein